LDLIGEFTQGHDANTQAADYGFGSASEMARMIYADFCELVGKKWSEIAPLAEKHRYWLEQDSGEDLARRRAAFSTLFSADDSALELLTGGATWIAMKARLGRLLSLLESQGCFVLRRGTIESYYLEEHQSIHKPTAAAEEVEDLRNLSDAKIRENYGDIVRCIDFAAKTAPISEAEALRDVLLAIIAPAIAKVAAGGDTVDVALLARTTVGDRGKLFELAVESAGQKDARLKVSLNSRVLQVQGFPMVISPEDNLVKTVNAKLGLS
jgi:hypothetical protein